MLRDVPHDSTSTLIAAVSNDLTPTERRIAEAVLEDPSLLAFGTVADLARQVGVSRPSVVRFAVKLGFDGYTSLQESVHFHHSATPLPLQTLFGWCRARRLAQGATHS